MTREGPPPTRHEPELTGAPTLEILVLWADVRGIRRLRPSAGGEVHVDGAPPDHPTLSVRLAVEAMGLVPRFVHSTSWRYQAGRVVLTYVAVVDPPVGSVDDFVDEAVTRANVARSGALEPPRIITMDQVLQHTIQHLAWLIRDDPAAREALGPWRPFLDGHRAEPFRAFDGAVDPPVARA
jgi:hypothetical protein